MSPGGYSVAALLFSVVAVIVGVLVGDAFPVGPALVVFLGLFAGYMLMLALAKCGYQKPTAGYHGSTCPRCGTRNRIWPWNF
jgi:hypothetical protein